MNSDIRFYWGLVQRRLPLMATALVLCSAIGIALALLLPPRYEASARLLVEGAQIPDELAASTVRTVAAERLQIIEQRLLTRANLIDIANKFRIFENTRRMTPDEVVFAMRDRTSIRTSSGRNAATLMTINFSAGDPNLSANVVNEYVTLILNEDSRRRQAVAEQTMEFFEQEVSRLNGELDQRSAAIVEFKERNQDALPENLDFRVGRQSSLQDQIIAATRDRAALTEQRNRLLALGSLQQSNRPALSPAQAQLQAAQNELAQALTIYSEANPRIRVLRTRVAQLEAAVAAETGGATEGDANDTPASRMFDLQLEEIDNRAALLDALIARATNEIEDLRVAIEKTPENAIRLEALEREYQNTLGQYNAAVANLAKAETGERIEVLSRGERISVIEQATPPDQPASPNRPLLAGGGIFAGVFLAAALFVLLEVTNRSIRRPEDLVKALSIQPIATIPYLETSGARSRRTAMQWGLVLASAVGIPVLLWAAHTYYMPLDRLIEIGLNRLGL